jgi:hypothetical protein
MVKSKPKSSCLIVGDFFQNRCPRDARSERRLLRGLRAFRRHVRHVSVVQITDGNLEPRENEAWLYVADEVEAPNAVSFPLNTVLVAQEVEL